jgi:hypothetical protein
MNPFTVLGISAAAVRGLKDEQAATLVKAMHRALALIHHPDRGGKQAKFRALQEALEELDWEANPEQFRYWRERLLRPQKQQLADSDEPERRRNLAEDALRYFATANVDALGIPERAYAVRDLCEVRILVSETLVNVVVGRQASAEIMHKNHQSCCELEVSAVGITRYPVLRQLFAKEAIDEMPPHHPKWETRGDKKDQRAVWVRAGKGASLSGARIIGGIPRDTLDSQVTGPRGITPLLSGSENAASDLPMLREGYDWDAFRRFGTLMRPFFKEQDELICFTGDRFIPVGRVRGVCSIAEWPAA